MQQNIKETTSNLKLRKSQTGINGFDEITDGGLPENQQF